MNNNQKELDKRIQNEGWIPLSELTKEYAEISSIIHVDTRDFHVNFSFESQLEDNQIKFRSVFLSIGKADYLTFQEVVERLKEWHEKSGGETFKDGSPRKWRMINHKRWGWFKYVRVFRTDKGYVWCTSIADEYRFFTNRNLSKNMEFEQYGD